jgi:hypothetical protein
MVFWSGSISTIYDRVSYEDSRSQSAPLLLKTNHQKIVIKSLYFFSTAQPSTRLRLNVPKHLHKFFEFNDGRYPPVEIGIDGAIQPKKKYNVA